MFTARCLVVAALGAAVQAWGGPPFRPSPPSELAPAPSSIFGRDPALDPATNAAAQRRGSLDKEIIRRIIRRHINEVKACYEPELAAAPELGGRIMVQFTISASGAVIASELQNSTVGNARVETCTVAAVRRWEFPKPLGGGVVIVSYPFVLTPERATPHPDGGASGATGGRESGTELAPRPSAPSSPR